MSSLILMVCLAASDVKIDHQSVNEVVDVIELHSCHDFRGRVAFRQLIFYRWSGYHRRFQIVDTVVVTSEEMCPRKSSSGFYHCQWKADSGIRIVRGLTFRQSSSTVDPEVAERDFLPTHLRKGLKQVEGTRSVGSATVRTTRVPSPERILKF